MNEQDSQGKPLTTACSAHRACPFIALGMSACVSNVSPPPPRTGTERKVQPFKFLFSILSLPLETDLSRKVLSLDTLMVISCVPPLPFLSCGEWGACLWPWSWAMDLNLDLRGPHSTSIMEAFTNLTLPEEVDCCSIRVKGKAGYIPGAGTLLDDPSEELFVFYPRSPLPIASLPEAGAGKQDWWCFVTFVICWPPNSRILLLI